MLDKTHKVIAGLLNILKCAVLLPPIIVGYLIVWAVMATVEAVGLLLKK